MWILHVIIYCNVNVYFWVELVDGIQSHLVVQILFSYKKYSLSLHCDE